MPRLGIREAAANSTQAGVEHGKIIDLASAGIAILPFQDPDNINIELTAPLP